MKRKATFASIGVGLCLGLALIVGGGFWQSEEPVARGPQTKCYKTSGGDKWVCRSGGEFEILSGGILDIQAGATAVWAGAALFTGPSSFTGAVSIAATPAATATPQVLILDVGAGVPFEVRNASATPEVAIDGGYELDMNANEIVNIGATGTDFSGTGGLTTAAGIVASAGGISATGGITVTTGGATITAGGLTVTAGDVTITAGLFLPTFADLAISDGDTITVTAVTVYGLDSAGEVTMTLAACTNEGQSVTLIGDDANTININTTNLRTTDGNALTLGQYDVIALICQDSEWMHMYKSANQ